MVLDNKQEEPPKKRKNKVPNVAYLRISKFTENLENQKGAIMRFSKEDPLFFSDVITGSSKSDSRKGYSKALEYIKEHRPEKLFVYEVSRIGRDLLETVKTILELEEEYGVMVISASPNESYMNNQEPIMRNFMLSIFSLVHNIELNNIKERTRNALEGKKKILQEGGSFISRSGNVITKLGRPERRIDWDQVQEYREKGLSLSAIARIMEFNYQWFIKKNKKHEKDLQEGKSLENPE